MRGEPLRRLIVVAAAAVAISGCGGGDDDEGGEGGERPDTPTSVPEDAVAVVADAEITRTEYRNWARVAASEESGATPPEGQALKEQVMEFLISSEWILHEAEARGIEASDDEVRQSFDDQREQSFPDEDDYREFLRTSGQTEEDVLFRVRLDLLSNRIRDEVTRDTEEVTDADVEAYYEENRQRFEDQSLDEARNTIRSILASEAEQKRLDAFVTDFRARWRERTLCGEEYVVPECSNGERPDREEDDRAPDLFGSDSAPGG